MHQAEGKITDRTIRSVVFTAIIFSGLWSTSALGHNITFTTDFENPTAGPGTIIESDGARIFKYVEDDLYATAIQKLDATSHYHLFGNGLVIGGDSEGVQFTFGGMEPTLLFNAESVEVLELGTIPVSFIPFSGGAAGPATPVTTTGTLNFDHDDWSGISHFIAEFETPLPGEGARLVLTNLDVHPAPVPEPSTMVLLGTGLAGLVAFRYRRHRSHKQQ